jgi:5'(3')-deoxyribonucleotidase
LTDRDRRISEQLVRLVQLVFGVVLAQSFNVFQDVLVHPLGSGHWLAAVALLTVYTTSVLSWIDWHTTMVLRPYNFNTHNRYRLIEQLRLFADLLVVIFYAYLLFTIRPFLSAPGADIGRHLLGYPLVFMGYAASGLARIRAHGRLASAQAPIWGFLALYVGLNVGYASLAHTADRRTLNAGAIAVAFALMVSYRITRRVLRARRTRKKEAGLTVGIDIDGVLGNQIAGVLPRVKRRLGLDLQYDDITDWRLPLGTETDIAQEIIGAMEDPNYILSMPVHPGAREFLNMLYRRNRVILVTARPLAARDWTREWLEGEGLQFDELATATEMKKSFNATDILVDDYPGNVVEYLTNTPGVAILLDQPWNRDRAQLDPWVQKGRLFVVKSLGEAEPIIERIRAEVAKRAPGVPAAETAT